VVALALQKKWEGTKNGFPDFEHRCEYRGRFHSYFHINRDFDKGKPTVKWGRKTKDLGDIPEDYKAKIF
jgi:hypothetical protein